MIIDKQNGILRVLLVSAGVVAFSLSLLAAPAAEPGDSAGGSPLPLRNNIVADMPVPLPEPLSPTLPSSPSDLPAPVDPEPEPPANLPGPEIPPLVQSTPAEPGLPPVPMPQPAEPGLSPVPMPQPAEPGLPPPPMPQPAEPPPLGQRLEPHSSVPNAPEQEPTPPSPQVESEPIAYEQDPQR